MDKNKSLFYFVCYVINDVVAVVVFVVSAVLLLLRVCVSKKSV